MVRSCGQGVNACVAISKKAVPLFDAVGGLPGVAELCKLPQANTAKKSPIPSFGIPWKLRAV